MDRQTDLTDSTRCGAIYGGDSLRFDKHHHRSDVPLVPIQYVPHYQQMQLAFLVWVVLCIDSVCLLVDAVTAPSFTRTSGVYVSGTTVALTFSGTHACVTDTAASPDPVCTGFGCSLGSIYVSELVISSALNYKAVTCNGLGERSAIVGANYDACSFWFPCSADIQFFPVALIFQPMMWCLIVGAPFFSLPSGSYLATTILSIRSVPAADRYCYTTSATVSASCAGGTCGDGFSYAGTHCACWGRTSFVSALAQLA
jgi:hypothetical protein